MKPISLIIPCHNTAATLPACWHSVRNQTIGLDAIECIFIDDASDDGDATWNTLLSIEQEAPEHVTVIRLEENLRQGGARNVGIAHAGGEYLQFLDADDELLPGACQRLYHLAQETGSDIIQFNHYIDSASGRREERKSRETKLYKIASPADRVPFLVGKIVNYGCWNKFYRMDIVRSSGAQFAEHLIYEEPPFVYPQFFFSSRIHLLDEPLYVNHLHPSQTMSALAAKRLTDHPQVQLKLLEYCLNRPELMQTYSQEIEFYFLWSFYVETIVFADQANVSLSEALLEDMRKTCSRLFPNWHSNPHVKELSTEYLRILAWHDK